MRNIILAATVFLILGCATTNSNAVGQTVEFNLKMENSNADAADYYNSVYYNVPIVIEFYYNGCAACNSNAPQVNKLGVEYHNFFNQIIDISIDCDRSDYDAWIRKHGDDRPILNACDRDLAESLGVRAYPTTIVLDENHREVYRAVGVWNAEKVAKIKSYLKTSH